MFVFNYFNGYKPIDLYIRELKAFSRDCDVRIFQKNLCLIFFRILFFLIYLHCMMTLIISFFYFYYHQMPCILLSLNLFFQYYLTQNQKFLQRYLLHSFNYFLDFNKLLIIIYFQHFHLQFLLYYFNCFSIQLPSEFFEFFYGYILIFSYLIYLLVFFIIIVYALYLQNQEVVCIFQKNQNQKDHNWWSYFC